MRTGNAYGTHWYFLTIYYIISSLLPTEVPQPFWQGIGFFRLGIGIYDVPFNSYPSNALNNILITSVIKMQKQGKLGNFLVLWESWCQAISCGLNDNCSPSVSVKADTLTSSNKVDCLTSCGFPDHMQPFWYHALDILHVSCC